MRRSVTRLLAVLLIAAMLPVAGCDKGEDTPEYTWPDQPADGCPVAIQFLEIVGEGDNREAKLRVFNFDDKRVEGLQMTLHYQNEAGEDLDTFPWGANSPSIAEPNAVGHFDAGAFMPPETTQVAVTIEQVRFADGSTWDRPE